MYSNHPEEPFETEQRQSNLFAQQSICANYFETETKIEDLCLFAIKTIDA